MEEKLICPVCGEPTSIYMGKARKDNLCRSHAKMMKDGLIVQCEKCNTWHASNAPCIVCAKEETSNSSDLKCILCGENSNGKHFCLSCYMRYKDKSIDVRIKKCSEYEIIDKYGNKTEKCDDGRWVRSSPERDICNFLYKNHIRFEYEPDFHYFDEETGESKFIHPDFFLPDYNLYIEYNGLKDKRYLKSKEYVMRIYKQANCNVVILTNEHIHNLSLPLKPFLKIH